MEWWLWDLKWAIRDWREKHPDALGVLTRFLLLLAFFTVLVLWSLHA